MVSGSLPHWMPVSVSYSFWVSSPMWTVKGWQIKDDYAPAVRGATDLFAEYLADAVNHAKIKSETNDRLVAMGGQALADALEALGDTDAAQAALTAAEEMANNAQSTVSAGSDVVSAARENLQTNFNAVSYTHLTLPTIYSV